jgi:hypothetical protein
MTSSFPRVTGYIFSKAHRWLSRIINKYYFEYLLSEFIPSIWSLLSHTDAYGKHTHVEPLVNPFSRCFERYFNSCFLFELWLLMKFTILIYHQKAWAIVQECDMIMYIQIPMITRFNSINWTHYVAFCLGHITTFIVYFISFYRFA